MDEWLYPVAGGIGLLLWRGTGHGLREARRGRRARVTPGAEGEERETVAAWKGLRIAAILFLAGAFFDGWPMGYFTLVRLSVFVASLHAATVAHRVHRPSWVVVLVVLAIIFNPIIPLFLDRDMWLVFDVVAAAVLGLSLVAVSGHSPGSTRAAVAVPLPRSGRGRQRREAAPAEVEGADDPTPGARQAALKRRLLEKYGKQGGASAEQRRPEALDATLDELIERHRVPDDVIRRKVAGYIVALRASGLASDWNADIDEDCRREGLLTSEEIERGRRDFEHAVQNRLKVALIREGWISTTMPRIP